MNVAGPLASRRTRRRWMVPALLLLAAVCLLVALQRVVTRSTDRAGLRQAASRAHADSLWQCRVLSETRERHRCIEDLGAVAAAE